MGPEAIITIAVIIIAVFFFITDYIPIDTVAIGIMVTLVLTGVITPEESVMGFANNATITVAAMFVLSFALIKTRIIEVIAPLFIKLFRKGYKISILSMSLSIGTLSAFINNTPVVASFIPIISHAAKRAQLSPSKFLMPLSFVAIFGGSCTLIGTSTNLLISGIAEDNGIHGFSMFIFVPLGAILFVVGTIYLMLFGKKLLKDRIKVQDMKDAMKIENYMTEIQIVGESLPKHLTVKDIFRQEGLEINVEAIKRGDKNINSPNRKTELKRGDILLVKGNLKKIKNLVENEYLKITESFKEEDFRGQETKLIEIVLLPNSEIIEKKLHEVDFLDKYQANILAIRQLGKQRFTDLKNIRLKQGDILLLETNIQGYELLMESERNRQTPFLSMNEVEVGSLDKSKIAMALGVIVTVIILATTGLVPIMIGALGGIVILNAFRIINMSEAYRAIDWQVIFLLAGALSLGKAMNNSGVSELLADVIINRVGMNYGPEAVVSALYLLTFLLTSIMSNNASAALLAPIAISISGTLGVNPMPLLLAIAFAGSASFLTPIGYQTNTMVFSAGNYKFSDFTKIGTPLNIIFWIIASFLIPYFYPL